MRHKIIYCEIDFLRVLFERLSKAYSPLDDNWAEGECARKIIKDVFSQEYVTIHYDDKQKFRQLLEDNEFFQNMVRCADLTEGYAKMTCDSYTSLEDIGQTSLNAIYFVVAGEDIASNNGVMALTPSSINNISLFTDFGKSIEKNSPQSWEKILKDAKHSCNALMAFDNYLDNGKEFNLYMILDALLPTKLPVSAPFQISLFMQEKPGIDLANERKLIIDKIQQIRPDLPFSLTIYKSYPLDFHDRAIITNNLWIGSEGGFDLLRKDKRGFRTESSKSTTIHMKYPFLQSNSDAAYGSYSNFISDAERIARKNPHYGDAINRLLSVDV